MGQTSVSTLSQNPSVDGLEKASLANSDSVVAEAQTPQLKQRGKLSSLGKIFKPWKWRKKKTSDKFQDLSKVLERKISTRQTREELIRKGVLIPDQDSEELIHSNGDTASISVEPVIEEVDISLMDDSQGDTDDKTGRALSKSLHPKKSAGASKNTTQLSTLPSSFPAARSRDSKEGTMAKGEGSGPAKTVKKRGKGTDPIRFSGSPKAAPEPESQSTDGLKPAAQEEVHGKSKAPGLEEKPKQDELMLTAEDPRSPLEEMGEELSNSQSIVEDTTFTESPSEVSSDGSEELLGESGDGDGEGCQSSSVESPTERPQQVISEVGGDEQRTQVTIPDSPDVTIIPDSNRESHTSDSDSDGPILYRDEEEEDEEDEYTSSSLASKIRRRDTLAIKLGNRPSKRELEEKNILPCTSETERHELRQQIGCKLVRRLSQRPTTEELEQRNILKQKNEEEEQEAKQEIKRRLSRKLSVRPTVAELVARRILRFNEYVEVTDAKDYDRRADKPWTRLTPADKAAIRKELNEFKSKEMEVHEESKQFTRFHRP
ncbi:phosphatase and actin regulator 2 isoform X4 [Conger conger]|uniref:phosphatase and actin regulator 2 isoform X4 n=1 Tax=Conger conger TaxID=82655 RepID=UPI002A5A6B10|nr:phosphatase and actin regulator 2 isoform X4 [Conger conger]